MKRTIKSFLAAAGLVVIGLGSMLAASPANAMVRQCTPYVPPVGVPNYGYPANTGHLYFCFPDPRNTAETNLQLMLRNNAAASMNNYTSAIRANLQSRNIKYYVFYNGTDAFNTLQVDTSNGEAALSPVESGRSWVFPASNVPTDPQNPTNKALPTTSVFVWSDAQYLTRGLNNRPPTQADFPSSQRLQLSATMRHETGHQLSRVWAQQLALTPTVSVVIDQNYLNWTRALAMDGTRLSTQDIADMKSLYPRLLAYDLFGNPTGVKGNEIFAELLAMWTGGGVSSSEGAFISANFPCTKWFTQQGFYASTGLAPNIGLPKPPATPSPGVCYGNTNWSQP